MKNLKIGSFIDVKQRETEGGNYAVTFTYITLEGRISSIKQKKIYRKNPITDISQWVNTYQASLIIEPFKLYRIGQSLIRDYRKAMDLGLLTKEQVTEVKDGLNLKYGCGTYTNRGWQRDAAHKLYSLTKSDAFYLTDAW